MGINYIDITPTINDKLAVFPGDKNFLLNTHLDFSKGDHLKLSSFSGTLHLGAHGDAPNHYSERGEGIHERSLIPYLGPVQVVEGVCENKPSLVGVESFKGKDPKASRILFKTGSFPDPYRWNDEFWALDPDLIDFLGKRGVVLVGIDTPSIDPSKSSDLNSHKNIFKHNMAILEGLVLDHVSEGLYQLVALPLKIEGADASPVRAILLPYQSMNLEGE